MAWAGTRDALFVLLFGPLGLTPAQSLAFASTGLVLYLSNCVVFYALSVLLRRGAVSKTPAKAEHGTHG